LSRPSSSSASFSSSPRQPAATPPTIVCMLCGVAADEIEGFIAENLTETEMVAELQELCAKLTGDAQTACDLIVTLLPAAVKLFETDITPSEVCVALKLCSAAFANGTDMTAMPYYVVDLDAPPQQRWAKVWSDPRNVWVINTLFNAVESLIGPDGMQALSVAGSALLDFVDPEYAEEIRGGAAAINMSSGIVTIVNIFYELQDFCTSIVAQTSAGKILHARNMDMGIGLGLTDLLRNGSYIVNYTRGGQLLYQSVQFPAFLGVFTASKPNGFSASIDTRYLQGPFWDMYEDFVAALKENATLPTWLLRRVFDSESTFTDAVQVLNTTQLVDSVYYIMGGLSANEGCVISRNRTSSNHFLQLDFPKRFFLAQTNWDWWQTEPAIDAGRYYEANLLMNQTSPSTLTLQKMLRVLSTKPVFNAQTTMTVLMQAGTGTFKGYRRWCNGACVE